MVIVADEDELAFVMSHEASHHILGHLARMDRNASEGAAAFGRIAREAVGATPDQIRDAVQTLFKVKVEEVRLFNVRGKIKRMGRYAGKRRDWRKAYVRLKAGEKAPEFVEGV